MTRLMDLELKPLAGESLGTRSMAIAIQAKNSQFIFDPGVDVAPRRYNLPPHSIEINRRKEHRENILQIMNEIPVAGFWVSHYHFDHFPKINEAVRIAKALHHFDPDLNEFPKAPFFIKDPLENINKNQKKRARKFTRALKKMQFSFNSAEEITFKTEEFTIKGSPILPHGEISPLGYVVGCSLTYKDTKLIYTGDTVGIPLDVHVDWITQENPDIIILDGPMKEQLEQFKVNIKSIIDKTNIKNLIVEHHLLRSGDWKELISNEIDYCKSSGVNVKCYAELINKKIELLEVNRKQLFEFLPESAPIHTKKHKNK